MISFCALLLSLIRLNRYFQGSILVASAGDNCSTLTWSATYRSTDNNALTAMTTYLPTTPATHRP